jgi:hypothetical protein
LVVDYLIFGVFSGVFVLVLLVVSSVVSCCSFAFTGGEIRACWVENAHLHLVMASPLLMKFSTFHHWRS